MRMRWGGALKRTAQMERGDIPWELSNAEDADCLVATHRHPQGANYICSQP